MVVVWLFPLGLKASNLISSLRCMKLFLSFFIFALFVCVHWNSSKANSFERVWIKMLDTWKRLVLLRKRSGNMRKGKRMRCTSGKDACTIQHEPLLYWKKFQSHCISSLTLLSFLFAYLEQTNVDVRLFAVYRPVRMKYYHGEPSYKWFIRSCLLIFIVERTETTKKGESGFCCDSFGKYGRATKHLIIFYCRGISDT